MPKRKEDKYMPDTEPALVEPVESVEDNAPLVNSNPCWNCGGRLIDDKCATCGFDKSLLYNPDLEAQRLSQKKVNQ